MLQVNFSMALRIFLLTLLMVLRFGSTYLFVRFVSPLTVFSCPESALSSDSVAEESETGWNTYGLLRKQGNDVEVIALETPLH